MNTQSEALLEENLLKQLQSLGYEDIKLCESVIYEREAYKNSFSNGLGILEFLDEKSKAYQDFNSFFDELVEYVNS